MKLSGTYKQYGNTRLYVHNTHVVRQISDGSLLITINNGEPVRYTEPDFIESASNTYRVRQHSGSWSYEPLPAKINDWFTVESQ